MDTTVDIILRTKDRPLFLSRALASIAAQTRQDYRVILVNDGGDAATVDGCLAKSSLDRARVTLVTNRSPLERSGSLACGIDAGEAPFIAVHDDDDTWDPTFLERTLAYADAHPTCTAVFVRTDIVYEELRGEGIVETSRVPAWPEITRISLARLAEENQGVPISVLYRREALATCGGIDPTLPVVEDWDLHVRLALAGEIGFIDSDHALAHWHQRPGLTGNEGNSTLDLAGMHAATDAAHRDRLLREWVNAEATNLGLLLYLGARFGDERRRYEDLVRRLDRLEARIDANEQASRVSRHDAENALSEQLEQIRESISQLAALANRVLDPARPLVRTLRRAKAVLTRRG
ncbi:MAG: glycosyltransferase [Actinomycetaceae bacterium]|nr:glycosyltransferase [Actinomycetaceae bacterium]